MKKSVASLLFLCVLALSTIQAQSAEDARKRADQFLKAIQFEKYDGFYEAGDLNALVKKAMKDYRSLPEYAQGLKALKFIKAVPAFVTKDGKSVQKGQKPNSFIVVYQLPRGMKASSMRAVSDIFHPGLISSIFDDKLYATDRVLAKTPSNQAWTPELLDLLVYPVIGKGPMLANFITVVVSVNPETKGFNIGMPPMKGFNIGMPPTKSFNIGMPPTLNFNIGMPPM